jgi:hypothetical protein
VTNGPLLKCNSEADIPHADGLDLARARLNYEAEPINRPLAAAARTRLRDSKPASHSSGCCRCHRIFKAHPRIRTHRCHRRLLHYRDAETLAGRNEYGSPLAESHRPPGFPRAVQRSSPSGIPSAIVPHQGGYAEAYSVWDYPVDSGPHINHC